MVSSQTRHEVPGFDEGVRGDDPDFGPSGLKVPSVLRIGRLAVIDGRVLLGAIGDVGPDRLSRIRSRLGGWIHGESVARV